MTCHLNNTANNYDAIQPLVPTPKGEINQNEREAADTNARIQAATTDIVNPSAATKTTSSDVTYEDFIKELLAKPTVVWHLDCANTNVTNTTGVADDDAQAQASIAAARDRARNECFKRIGNFIEHDIPVTTAWQLKYDCGNADRKPQTEKPFYTAQEHSEFVTKPTDPEITKSIDKTLDLFERKTLEDDALKERHRLYENSNHEAKQLCNDFKGKLQQMQANQKAKIFGSQKTTTTIALAAVAAVVATFFFARKS